MSVPNTDTFYLQDVVDEINAENPTVETLQECFDNSTDVKFDFLYKLYKDRLSNFRNYNSPKSVTIRPYLSYTKDKSIYMTGMYFENVRWCSGTPVLFDSGVTDKHPVGVEMCGGGVFNIWRGYLAYDLTLLSAASEVTIIDVALHSRKVSAEGAQYWFNAVKTNWGSELDAGDACSTEYPNIHNFYDLLTGTRSSYTQSDSSYVYKLEADSFDVASFETNCLNRIIYIALISGAYDYADTVPPSIGKYTYDLYKGNQIDQSVVWNTELRVGYWGFSFLNAYPDICYKEKEADTERIFVTADDGNACSAWVTTGDTWLSIPGLSVGTGSYKFEISLTENTTSFKRYGVITIYSSAYTSPYSVNIEQEGTTVSPYLYCLPNPYDVSYKDTDRPIQVATYSTNPWTASLVDSGDGISWISFVGGNTNTGDGLFTINVDDNDGVARSCDIKIESDVSDYTVVMNQESGGISSGSLHITSVSTTDSQAITVTPDYMNTTSVKEDDGSGDGTAWFKITAGATGDGDFTLSIELMAPPKVDKSAQIRITDDDSGIEEVIGVTFIYVI